jgi:hypothetical protein
MTESEPLASADANPGEPSMRVTRKAAAGSGAPLVLPLVQKLFLQRFER